jgi:cyclopropane fatty-acyl-phospholipid synthase-like methyltransferase
MGRAAGDVAGHWDRVYGRRLPTEMSWYQEEPRVSLALLDALDVTPQVAIVDVGGGASVLVDRLLDRRFGDVSVLDVSAAALAHAKQRLAERAACVHWLREDVLTWRPERRYGVWHDRAVFHFLVEENERAAYLASLRAALTPEGRVAIGTFAGDGPQHCSGLPVQRYEAGALAAVFGAEFEVVEQRREEHQTPNGTEQPFTWVGMVWHP